MNARADDSTHIHSSQAPIAPNQDCKTKGTDEIAAWLRCGNLIDLEVMSIKSGRRGNLRRFWAELRRKQRDGEYRTLIAGKHFVGKNNVYKGRLYERVCVGWGKVFPRTGGCGIYVAQSRLSCDP
jgi:hypothetical protein